MLYNNLLYQFILNIMLRKYHFFSKILILIVFFGGVRHNKPFMVQL